MPLKDGIYIIINVKQRNLVLLEDPNDETPLRGHYRQKNPREHWRVIDRGNGHHAIQNVRFQRYAYSGTRAGLGASVEGRDREQLWYIQERSKGKYTIATTDSGNFWMLPDHELQTPVELLDVPTDKRCWWIFANPETESPVDDGVAHGAVLFELKMLPIVPFSPLRFDFIVIQEITDHSVSNASRTIGGICGPLVSSTQPDALRVDIVEFQPLESSIAFFRRFTGFFTVEKLCNAGDSDISWQTCGASSLPEIAVRGLRTDATKVVILNLSASLLHQCGQAIIKSILTPIQSTFYDSDIFRELWNLSFEFQPFEHMDEFLNYALDYNEMVAVPRFIEDPEPCESIIRAMPHLTQLLKGGDDARLAAVAALSKLAEHEEFHKIKAIPRDSSGRTPLSWAAGRGYNEVVRPLLVLEGDLDAKDNNGQTPLSWAAEEGRDEVVKLLLAKNGVDINSKTKVNDTPLIWAASKGHSRVVSLLLAHKDVEVNTKQNDGLTPLSVAARAGHNQVVRLLLEKGGVDVDSKDKAGRTPLSHAAEEARDEVVKLLLAKNGVDANSKSKSNDTPLMWAAYRGHSGVVHLLLAHKDVDINAENDDGRTPLSLADDGGHDEVKRLLNVRVRRLGNGM